MRVAIFQAAPPKGDLALCLAVIDAALADAAAEGADLLVMPELYLPGYLATGAKEPAGLAKAIAKLPVLARAHRVALTIGLAEYLGGQVYNTAHTYGPDGALVAQYRKIQLFGPNEAAIFTPGNSYSMFKLGGVTCAMLICYDVEFYEHVRAVAAAGATLILAPTANMMPFENINAFLVPARAAENAITIAYANYCGAEAPLDYVGGSVIAGPDGYPLAQAGGAPGLIVADVPADLGVRGIPHATHLQDYREVPKR